MKKTECITFRTTAEIKDALAEIAAPKKWSISLLVEDIVTEWLKQNPPQPSADAEK